MFNQRPPGTTTGSLGGHRQIMQVKAIAVGNRLEIATERRQLAKLRSITHQIGTHPVFILGNPGGIGRDSQTPADDSFRFDCLGRIARSLDGQHARHIVNVHVAQGPDCGGNGTQWG